MNDFITYLSKPETLIAVITPLWLALAIMIYEWHNAETDIQCYYLCFISIPLSFIFSYWAMVQNNNMSELSLHILPLFPFLACIPCLLGKWKFNPATFAMLTFFNQLSVDIVSSRHPDIVIGFWAGPHAVNYTVAQNFLMHFVWYKGIGGAGLSDSLLLAPLFGLVLGLLIKKGSEHYLANIQLSYVAPDNEADTMSPIFSQEEKDMI